MLSRVLLAKKSEETARLARFLLASARSVAPQVARNAAGHPKGRNEVEEPQGLTRRPMEWFRSADSRRGRDTLSPMDTHAAVRMLTAAGADETLAVAVVDVAQNAAADHGRELSTRSDLDHLREVQRADLAALEARLTWRFAGAMLAQTLAILGGVVAILRLLG